MEVERVRLAIAAVPRASSCGEFGRPRRLVAAIARAVVVGLVIVLGFEGCRIILFELGEIALRADELSILELIAIAFEIGDSRLFS